MNRVRVKICGITSVKDLNIAVDAGADAIGMVVDVPQSPRNISITQAKELIKTTPLYIDPVVVTVPEDVDHLVKINQELKPRILQIHGLEDSYQKIRDKLSYVQLFGAVRVKPGLKIEWVVKFTHYLDAILLDSYVPEKKGGSGITHDWGISKRIKEAIAPTPLVLAGGLTPQNIKEAIRTVKPYAVDVSTGVEASPGRKDRDKVFKFVKKAKEVKI